MKIEVDCRLLTAESTPYNFGGNSGVSHKIRINVNGEIYVCKSDETQVNSLKQYVGKEGVAIVEVLSRKENMSLSLKNFSPKVTK